MEESLEMTKAASESPVVLKVKGLRKKFCRNLRRSMFYGILDLVKNLLGIRPDCSYLRKDEFWALKDIGFELREGEVLGFIGVNGAGKSTLLRVINGIFPPDTGRVEIRGKIGGLIALGAGFHPHMTGRENVFLNGTILGMTRKELDEKFESIVNFADIGLFMDAPVSTYSSGMKVRLGFSIAIHCEPQILLIDEVLSVGDAGFQNKCLRKIAELKSKAKAIVFVGHNMDTIRIICDRVILLNEGRVEYAGDPEAAVARYLSITRANTRLSDDREVRKNYKDGKIYADEIDYLGAGLLNESGEKIDTVKYGEDLILFYDLSPNVDIEESIVAVGFRDIRNFNQNVVYHSNINNPNIRIPPLVRGNKYRIKVRFCKPNIMPGVYRLNIAIRNLKTLELYHHIRTRDRHGFEILPVDMGSFVMEFEKYPHNSIIHIESQWECEALAD